jgi:K+ transporter
MKIIFKIIKIINIIALVFLLAGAYGIAITGALQVLAGILFLIIFPKNSFIYIYFILVATFFLIWDGHTLDWLFLLPIALVFFLTFIIYNQKKKS